MLKNLSCQLKFAFFPCQENNFRPLALQRQFLIYYVLLFLALKMVIFPFYLLFPKTSFFAEVISSTLIELTNQERQSSGLSPLKESLVLNQAALAKAKDMIENDYFNHTSPSGITPWYWFKQKGYAYRAAGENLAIGFLDSAEVEKAWTESPSHRQNLLNSNFKEIGIAVLTGNFQGKETTIVVQFFGNPIAKPVVARLTKPPKPISTPKPILSPEPIISIVETPVNILAESEVLIEPEAPIETLNPEPLTEAKGEFNLPVEVFSFGSNKYDQITSQAITVFLLFLIGALIFNFLVNLIEGIKRPELVLDAAFFILLLFISNLVDKQLIISLIPHNLTI
ncbi:CAP domain-containing protein [Candidatus Parcubacteria bacterium]|nr:CAP domain-containing protein [Patescibacteria group bacterium]MBU4466681.1 CAP domain-containing protein [Patescibacteria group bacterium]MCG2688415.1 CAP domain-containing protein [Candidatus Parcubacteria bacterium]